MEGGGRAFEKLDARAVPSFYAMNLLYMNAQHTKIIFVSPGIVDSRRDHERLARRDDPRFNNG
jgi:hypothetical protein